MPPRHTEALRPGHPGQYFPPDYCSKIIFLLQVHSPTPCLADFSCDFRYRPHHMHKDRCISAHPYSFLTEAFFRKPTISSRWSQMRITLMRSRIRIFIQVNSWIRFHITVKSWILIRIKMMQISKPACNSVKYHKAFTSGEIVRTRRLRVVLLSECSYDLRAITPVS